MDRRKGASIVVMAGLLLFAGCSFFSRSQSRYYSLDRIAGTAVNARGVPVAIDGVELPPGTDRKEVAVRKAEHQLDVRSAEQWTATLQPLVLHTLAFDLASRLPAGMMILPGQARPSGVMRSIDVVFADFSAGPESRVTLDATFVIHGSGVADVTYHEPIAIDIPSLDSANVATGYSQALATLADRIAAAVAR